MPNLEAIYISKNLTSGFTGRVFEGSRNVTTLIVSEDNPVYHSEDNCVIYTDISYLVAGCKGSHIPNSVKYIASQAFCDTGITDIVIPSTVQQIS